MLYAMPRNRFVFRNRLEVTAEGVGDLVAFGVVEPPHSWQLPNRRSLSSTRVIRSSICYRVDSRADCNADNTAPRAVSRFNENDESSSTSTNHRTCSTYARTNVSISAVIASSEQRLPPAQQGHAGREPL